MEQAASDFREIFKNTYWHDADLYGLMEDICIAASTLRDRGTTEASGQSEVRFSNPGLSDIGLFVALFVPVLYSWANLELNARRQKIEIEAALARLNLIQDVQERFGLDAEIAKEMANAIMEAVAKRDREDPSLRKVRELAALVLKDETSP